MRTRVHVVMGGPSEEYEISLLSGREVLLHLDRQKYIVRAVVVSRDHHIFCTAPNSPVPSLDDLQRIDTCSLFAPPRPLFDAADVWHDCDVAFLAMHGEFGEDGVMQGYLDAIGIPYQGSGVYASAVAMNKITSRALFERHGLCTPPGSVIAAHEVEEKAAVVAENRGFPCFVKCPQSGSSRLMGRATDMESLLRLLRELSLHAQQLLIETAIEGVEFSCGVLEFPDGSICALPPVEIRPLTAEYFDFSAKYSEHGSQEIVPAPRPECLLKEIRQTALTAHTAIGCRGISRTDMIWNGDRLYVLELNSLPGLTSASLLPKAFQSQGKSFGDLLDILIATTLAKNK